MLDVSMTIGNSLPRRRVSGISMNGVRGSDFGDEDGTDDGR
jgi:hypothetical protein